MDPRVRKKSGRIIFCKQLEDIKHVYYYSQTRSFHKLRQDGMARAKLALCVHNKIEEYGCRYIHNSSKLLAGESL